MDHLEAQGILDLAAAEPGGYERLAAGDTAESAALAAHLAGCPGCADAFARLASLSVALRAAVRSMPPPDLRDRTLAFVAATGRPRGADAPADAADAPADAASAAPVSVAPIAPPVTLGRPATVQVVPPVDARRRSGPRWPWLVAIAAAIVLAVAGVAGWWNASTQLETARATAADLHEITSAAVEIASAPDARSVSLSPAGDDPATQGAVGRLVYTAERGDLVVLAEGLPALAPGQTYGCWVEDAGGRRPLGSMTVSGDLAYWAGWSDNLSGAAPDARFGVSLVTADAATSQPVLVGP